MRCNQLCKQNPGIPWQSSENIFHTWIDLGQSFANSFDCLLIPQNKPSSPHCQNFQNPRGASDRNEFPARPSFFNWKIKTPRATVKIEYLKNLILAKENLPTLSHAMRTAVAALVSLLAARLFRLPETYWAAISCLVVMQSTLGAALAVSVRRAAGTAIGVAAGALAATWFQGSAFAFGAVVFLLGLLCAALRIDRSAYRYASIALAIVMLIARTQNPWIVAMHRFVEVSIGIAVALAVTSAWPERESSTTAPPRAPNASS